MWRVLKRLGIFLAIGAVVGDIITLLIAPRMLTWFQTPGAGSALCNCVDLARQTARGVVRAQLIGATIGAVALAVLGEIVVRMRAARKRKAEAGAAAEAAPAAPAAKGGQ